MNRITSTCAGAAALMAGMGLANIFCAPSLPQSNESAAEDPHLGPLRTYKFDTVRMDARGVVVEHLKGQAQYFVEDVGDGVTIDMVAIPGGTFLMGSPEDETDRSIVEGPQHGVSVSAFYIGEFEVTQAQWREAAGAPKVNRDLDPAPSILEGDYLPVSRVSWEDATEFCARLARKTGRGYRLPSEAEWEYACRAGTTTPFAFGEAIGSDLVCYDGNDQYNLAPKGESRKKPVAVGSLGVANGFGLYDMHGNVWEWCMDNWHDYYAGAPGRSGVWEGGYPESRVLRGGSWYDSAKQCRSAYRLKFDADARVAGAGFRVAMAARK